MKSTCVHLLFVFIRSLYPSFSSFPLKIGFDVAGTVVAVGSTVTGIHLGDEVFSVVPVKHWGTVAEYALSTEAATVRKPPSSSFAEVASLTMAALTAFQALEIAEKSLPGGLKGKTVLIPAGLSGTGGYGVQLAKNHFGAAHVITTVSTSKIPMVAQFLGEGIADTVIDYTKENVAETIGTGTVDVMFDTMGYTFPCLSVMKRGGLVISITNPPSGTEIRKLTPDAPFWVYILLDFLNFLTSWRVERKGVKYTGMLTQVADGPSLEKIGNMLEKGTIKPLIGSRVKMGDIEAVRRSCSQVLSGKGGVGKLIIDL
jgi:NADPH:quinone reductase-like Zn-dependent oxidoreductase